MDGEVEAHKVNESCILAEAKEVGQVVGVVLGSIDSRELALAVEVVVDSTSDVRKFSDPKTMRLSVIITSRAQRMNLDTIDLQVHAILVGRSPVILLVDAILVRLGKGRVVVQGGNGDRKLAHRVEGGWTAVDEFLDKLGKGSTSGPVGGETLDLLNGGDFAGEEKPEETLRQRLGSTGSFREQVLAFRNGLASESDALICGSTKKE